MIGANVSAFSIGKAVGRGGGAPLVTVDYVLVAGGGAGARGSGAGGGGAGGLLTSSGSTALSLLPQTAYSLTIGAGAPAPTGTNVRGPNGSNSIFSTLTSIGGGGKAQVGGNAPLSGGGYGGNGQGYTIQGFTVPAKAGGGGGGVYSAGYSGGSGGSGGGGNGGVSSQLAPTNGAVSTGGGGGGVGQNHFPGSSGGSGSVILIYPDAFTPTFTAGVTSSTTSASGYKKTEVTAAGPSDTVTFG